MNHGVRREEECAAIYERMGRLPIVSRLLGNEALFYAFRPEDHFGTETQGR